jgi:type IV pilus assembly protein PilM
MDNILQKILDTVKNIIPQKTPESIIGIDIGASAIKVVQLKKHNNKAILETYGSVSLGPYDNLQVGQLIDLTPDKLVTAILDVLKASNVTTKNAVVSIPAVSSLIFLIEIPPMVKVTEFKDIVPTEARKYIPVPITEVSLDWWMIPRKDELQEEIEGGVPVDPDHKTEVLVSAIHKDTVGKYQGIIRNSGLNSDLLEIEIFSSVRSTLGREMSSVLVMDIGASKTKLIIVEHGIVKGFHIIDRGSADMSEALSKSLDVTFAKAEEMKKEFGLLGDPKDKNILDIIKLSADYIFSETNSIVLNYEKKYNKTIGKVILTGGGSLLKGFIERATDNFKCDVVYGDPFAKTETPEFLNEVLKNAGPEFSVAVGLALRKLQ